MVRAKAYFDSYREELRVERYAVLISGIDLSEAQMGALAAYDMKG